MDVTRTNFKEVLATLPEVFKNAQFITLDTEFTGLRFEGTAANIYDTLNEYYLKDKIKADMFMAIQYGIVAFKYNETENRYTHQAYNFYVYPARFLETNFMCQTGSIEFLTRHGFDFNKLFFEGIPYIRERDVEKVIDKLADKYEKIAQLDSSVKTDYPIPDDQRMTIDGIHKKIENFLKLGTDNSLILEKHNSFVRRLIYNSTREKFGSDVLLETNRDETMTVLKGLSEADIKKRQKEKFLSEKQEVLDSVGFTKVIKLIIESGKTLIGHNMFFDLLFTVKQFLHPLPDSYTEFKDMTHHAFNKLIDTKYMASVSEFKSIKDTSLEALITLFEQKKLIPEVGIEEKSKGYAQTDNKYHEAAYDAYLTGLCFLCLSDSIGKQNVTNIFKTLPGSPLIADVVNKLYAAKLLDIPYMNFGGKDVSPLRTNVFHMTFPPNWRRDDIIGVFKEYGFINIGWINDTSAFIGVKREQVKHIKKRLLNTNKEFKLITYEDYQKNKVENGIASKSSPLSSKNVVDGVEKKRIQLEDVGEVVIRPQKKICSVDSVP